MGNYSLMNALRSLCLVLTVLCVTKINPVLADAALYDLSNFPGCVARNIEVIEGDIPLAQLRYKSIAEKKTDKPNLHNLFLDHINKKIKDDNNKYLNNTYDIILTVYFEVNQNVYKQIAAAAICKDELAAKNNDCRNRTYFFFSHVNPIILADVIVNDISKNNPIIRRCVWDK